MIYGITFASDNMAKSSWECRNSMLLNGIQEADIFGPSTLDDEFIQFNYETLNADRGAGFWVWKPYIIYRKMLSLQDNDFLIYSDAGIEFVNNVSHIIDKMDEDIFFFTNGWPHVEWCKADVLKGVLGWEGYTETDTKCSFYKEQRWIENVKDIKQVQASVIFFRVNQKTKDFVKEWLLYCQMPGFIDDSPSKLPNYPTFAEHRHDQAILTCLQIKYGYKLHFWPTNYSEHIRHTAQPGDNYPTIFNHHRRRNAEY